MSEVRLVSGCECNECGSHVIRERDYQTDYGWECDLVCVDCGSEDIHAD